MDAFYASVEQRDDPTLAGRPVVVGGSGSRGVVAAASYEARRYGITSAMPMVRARRLCAALVVVAPDFARYVAVSGRVRQILIAYTPLVEPLALDEAFLDVAGAGRLFGEPTRIAAQVRADVRDQLGLSCSVGVAPNKFLAKLCSGKAKPDGLVHLPRDRVAAFLRPLPVSDLWGVGPRTLERLHRYGFHTVGQLADSDRVTLERVLGGAVGGQLHRLARGIDDRPVTPYEPAKSISVEETYDRDLDDPEVIARELLGMCRKVGRRLRDGDLAGRTITLKVRFSSFQTVTRSATLDLPTDRTHDLVTVARELYGRLRLERVRIRLLGVAVTNLTAGAAARQLALDGDQRWEDAERAADALRHRFGGEVVTYGALLDSDAPAGNAAPTRDDLEG
ncbi:MAG: DNA polymerase IV [Actinobacteria bacterium]|nr:DNA polymerase IV [Actinomycetota bacterium]